MRRSFTVVSMAVALMSLSSAGASTVTGGILVPTGDLGRGQRCAQTTPGAEAVSQGVVGWTTPATAGSAFVVKADAPTSDFDVDFLKVLSPCADGALVSANPHENVLGDEGGIVPADATYAMIRLHTGLPGATFSYSESAVPSGLLSPQTSGVTVAMIDTGVRASHQEFNYCGCAVTGTTTDPDPADQVVGWWDFSRENPVGKRLAAGVNPKAGQVWDTRIPNPYDKNGHGTGTASLSVGRNTAAIKDAAFAPGFRLAIAKVGEGDGSVSGDLTAALNWAVNTIHADVVSMSIGSIVPFPALDSFYQAAADARAKGVLIVVANGNGWGNAAAVPGEPGWATNYGNSSSVLSVGASGTDSATNVQDGRNATTDPEVTSKFTSASLAAINKKDAAGKVVPCDDCYIAESGTSFAAPLVAGMAARLIDTARANGRDSSPAHIETLLKYSARDTGAPANSEGYGKLNYQEFLSANGHAAAGTLPSRPSPDINGLYVETVSGGLRDAWTKGTSGDVDIRAIKTMMSTGIFPANGPQVIGASAPTGLGEGEVYTFTLAPGQTADIAIDFIKDPDLGDVNDFDVYAFSGAGPNFSGADEVTHSANGAGVAEKIKFSSASGGTYSLVVLGWSIVTDQAYTLTSNASLAFVGDEYKLHTYGSGF